MFVTEKCCVFFEVQTECFNINVISTRFGFRALNRRVLPVSRDCVVVVTTFAEKKQVLIAVFVQRWRNTILPLIFPKTK
jgi:hypothetical protein